MRLRAILAPATALVLAATLTVTGTGAASAASATTERPRAAASSAPAGTRYVVLTGGSTSLSLDPGTAGVLADNGITVTPASEATATSSGIRFPIQGGVLKGSKLAGTINHSGGLTFSAGGKDLTIRDFSINTRRGTLSAFVDQTARRITALGLDAAKAKVKMTAKRLTISRVEASLDAGAAAALNAYYGVDLFTGGLPIGTAKVSARILVLRR